MLRPSFFAPFALFAVNYSGSESERGPVAIGPFVIFVPFVVILPSFRSRLTFHVQRFAFNAR